MEVKFEYRGFIVQATYYLYFVVLQCLGNQSKVVVKMKSDWKGQRKKKNISENVSNQVLPKECPEIFGQKQRENVLISS